MAMATHMIGTREAWLAARLELLQVEKELTRRSDEIARQRQALPWVRIDKDYGFDTDQGTQSLHDLFAGRSQLLVYHFMFGPDWKAGCPSCSMIADGFNGLETHLANHDVMLWAVSRAPLETLQAYKQRMGWRFPWASSGNGDFNFDFNVSFTEEQQRDGLIEYNYDRCARVFARQTRHERLRPGGWHSLPRLFYLFARRRRHLGRLSVARSRAQGTQRDGRLVAPPRRIRQALSEAPNAAD